MNHNIEVLKILNDNKNISQRKLSDLADISLGKINSIIKELTDKEYIKINQKGKKNVNYELTDLGINILEKYLNEIKDTKLEIHKENLYNVKQAVILGAGAKSEFGKPAGFLDIEEGTIIDRIIEILKYNNIEKVVIVTGYKKEYYEELASKYNNIFCVENKSYKWTGTMSSLALAKEYIDDDFLLIENDLVFEGRAIEQLIKNKNRDCILLTNESGSGDEAFVEIRNGFVFKMSKDIHQFNKIDGEMIGLSKFSYKLYNMMLNEFSHNINPYMNYEYTMLDVARNYKVGYEKINDLVWGEVDNLEQYKKVKNYIMPVIRRREMQYKIDQVKKAVIDGLNIQEKDIKEISPIGGMTNKNYKVKVKDKYYIVRIAGIGTTSMINRYHEMCNVKLAAEIGLDAKIVSFNESTGVKIAEFIEGAETLNTATARKKENMELVVDVLRKLHNSNIDMKNRFDVFEKIEEYEELAKKAGSVFFDDYYDIKEKVMKLLPMLKDNGIQLAPCHNDTLPDNFVKDSYGRLYLIDWEYSGLNDPMWDLAAHSIECEFSEDEEELLLNLYFSGNIQKTSSTRVFIYKILQDFLWSTWTIIKEAQGDNFGTYGIDRYNRAKRNLKRIFEME